MKVLSLFDGISCGLVALKRLEVQVDEYHAFEIDENAIKVSNANHPEIIRHGDVLTADFTQFIGFDLLIGGSPCQDLSIAKSNGEGLKGSKSSLFWTYVEALRTAKPRYFLFENVGSMKDSDRDIITEALGVEPILINSSDFLPQNRERYYWTNIPVSPLLTTTNTSFRSVMEEQPAEKYYYKKDFTLFEDRDKNVIGELKVNCYESGRRLHNPDGIIGCLTCVNGGYQEKKVYDDRVGRPRKLTPIEYERLQGLPDNYTKGLCDSKRYSVCGNGWTIPVIEHLLRGMTDGTNTTQSKKIAICS